MPMSSGLSSEGQSSSRAPKAPRSRTRLRAQQVAENAQAEAKKSESVQAASAQSQLTQPQATPPQVVKSAEATGTAKPSEAMKSADAVKPVEVASSEASAQPSGAQSAATQPSATQSSSSVRHMPRKPVVHKSHSQNGADSSASKSAAAVHSSAQSLKDSVRSALMTGRTVSEVEHAPELFDVEAFEDSSSKTSSAKDASAQTASSQSVKSTEKEVADQKAAQKSSDKKSSAGSAESREESAAQNAEESADKEEKAVEEPRPASRFGRWRAEREQQRAAEIEKERERASRQAQRERLRQDPGLDGLRAEERPRKERAPLTRARKLLYTASALAIIAVLYVVLVFFSPLLATQKITVRGTSLLETTQVEQKLEPLRGVPLTRIDEKKVRELIGQDNVIRSVQVESRPPHELVVTLKERTAVAVVKQGDTYHTVDSDGVSLLESATQPDTSVPLVRFSGDDPQASAEFRTISTALSAMPSELLAQVKEAGATSTSSITLTLRDNTTVQWGTAEESELKAKVLLSLRQAIAKRAQEEKSSEAQTQKVTVYDVSAPRVPVTR